MVSMKSTDASSIGTIGSKFLKGLDVKPIGSLYTYDIWVCVCVCNSMYGGAVHHGNMNELINQNMNVKTNLSVPSSLASIDLNEVVSIESIRF